METLLEKAQRLGIKPENNSSESLLDKAKRLGIKPAGVSSTTGKYAVDQTPASKLNKMAQIQAESAQLKKESDYANSPIGFASNFGKAVVNTVASSEVNLGKTLGGIFGVNRFADTYTKAIDDNATQRVSLIKLIAEKKARGEDTEKLKGIYNDLTSVGNDLQNELGVLSKPAEKSNAAVVGELGGTTLDLLTAGTYKGGSGSFKLSSGAPSAATAVKELAKNPKSILTLKGLGKVAEGAAIGYGFDVTQGLQGNRGEDRTGGQAAIPGLGTLIGAGLPIVTGSAKSVAGLKPSNLQKSVISQVEEDWNRIGADYVKSNKVLEKGQARGKDAPKFLTEHGVDPYSLVENNQFKTTDVADRLVTQDIQPFENVLDTSLKLADSFQPQLPIAELERNAIRAVGESKTLTVGQKATMRNSILNEFKLLREQYGDTITRFDLNGEKKIYWGNTKFDSNNPLQSDVHYIIGKSAKEAIEQNTKDVNVQELNSYLGDYYESAKFLRAMNGRTPKLTMGQKIQRGIIKGATTYLGANIGGAPGGIGGYIAGQSIAQALDNFSNPLRAYFLKELETSIPKAYEEAIQWIANEELDRMSRPRLEGPKELGTPENPIITPAPTTYEPAAQQINNQDLNGGKNSSNTNSPQVNNSPSTNTINDTVPQKSSAVNKESGFASGKVLAPVAASTFLASAGARYINKAEEKGKVTYANTIAGTEKPIEKPIEKPVEKPVEKKPVEKPKEVVKNPNVIAGVDLTRYAENPKHETNVRTIYENIPEIKTPKDINVYIDGKFPKNKLTGEIILKAAKKHDVDVKLLMAILQEDSGFGTAGLGSKTKNPGNVRTYGKKVTKFDTWADGVNAAARVLAKFKSEQ